MGECLYGVSMQMTMVHRVFACYKYPQFCLLWTSLFYMCMYVLCSLLKCEFYGSHLRLFSRLPGIPVVAIAEIAFTFSCFQFFSPNAPPTKECYGK